MRGFFNQKCMCIDFLNSFTVSSAFEWCREEYIDTTFEFFCRDESCWKTEDIGIVVVSCESRDLSIPCESCSDCSVLVRSHRHTIPTSTDEDTVLSMIIQDIFCDSMSKIRKIIRRSRTLCPVGCHRVTERFE